MRWSTKAVIAVLLIFAVNANADLVRTRATGGGGIPASGGTFTGEVEFSGQTNISGPDATTNVEIGSIANNANAGTGGTSVVIGNGATNTINGTGTVIIGSAAAITTSSGVDSMAIGRAATVTSANGIAIGAAATAANASVALGNAAQAATTSIAIGNASIAAAGELVAGSASITTSNLYFGKGKTSTTATSVTINGTGGSGSNNAGAALQIAGGKGTGTAAGGDLVFQTSPSIASGSTAQTLENRGIVRAQQFALTDNTIATFAVQTLGNDTGGGGTLSYCVYAADATTAGLECGEIDYAGVDVTAGAGGEVCTNPVKHGTPIQALSGSTLSVTFAATTGTDLCNIRVTADTNIATPVELWIKWSADNSGRALAGQ
jgi:hypothetical protein